MSSIFISYTRVNLRIFSAGVGSLQDRATHLISAILALRRLSVWPGIPTIPGPSDRPASPAPALQVSVTYTTFQGKPPRILDAALSLTPKFVQVARGASTLLESRRYLVLEHSVRLESLLTKPPTMVLFFFVFKMRADLSDGLSRCL